MGWLRRCALSSGLLLASLSLALAAEDAGHVAAILSGQVVRLDDGRTLRLAGLHYDPDERAQRMLAGLVADQPIRFEVVTPAPDRYGRLVVQLWRGDGLWVQGAMLEAGAAMVETTADENDRARDMLGIEAAARDARRGLWGRFPDPVVSPEQLEQTWPWDGYFLVEGQIAEVAQVGTRWYLNFGEDWREDVTAQISTRHRRRFAAAGFDPATLAGRSVRIRGWVYPTNGPMIDLTHPAQIEWLAPEEAGTAAGESR